MEDEQESQIHRIEIDMETAKYDIKRADALSRLHSNADFKLIFLDDYFVQEASRLVLLRADPMVDNPRELKQIEDKITGIGVLRQHFGAVYQLGNMSQAALREQELTREELLEEQLSQDGTLQ